MAIAGSVSKEQIARAKEISIEEYILASEPDNVKRVGNAYYLRDHDSLEISNGLWNWHSQGIGGKNVIDYLIFVRNYDFVGAVRHLASDDAARIHTVPPKARPPNSKPSEERGAEPAQTLMLPRRNADNARVIAYLRSRGIDAALITDCIRRGILYESADWHNCVFVGRDNQGKARFAAIRGAAGNFKRDADGSDKRYGFGLPHNGDSKTAAIFESPIDLLSHVQLCPDFTGFRLSLGGTALAALTHFLKEHADVSAIVICTDNDEAGNLAAAKIAQLSGYTLTRQLPPAGKDWNEALQTIKKAERMQSRSNSYELR